MNYEPFKGVTPIGSFQNPHLLLHAVIIPKPTNFFFETYKAYKMMKPCHRNFIERKHPRKKGRERKTLNPYKRILQMSTFFSHVVLGFFCMNQNAFPTSKMGTTNPCVVYSLTWSKSVENRKHLWEIIICLGGQTGRTIYDVFEKDKVSSNNVKDILTCSCWHDFFIGTL